MGMEETVYNNTSDMEMEITKASWWAVLLEGVIAVLVGLFLLLRPATTTVLLMQVLGIYWLASGVLSFLGAIVNKGEESRTWKFLSGILSVIAGLFILTYPYYGSFILLRFFIIFIGIWVIVSGAVKLYSAFKRGGWGIGAVGILTIILGLLLLTNSLIGILVLPWIFGFFLVIGGIAALILGIKMRS
jgi:uncharacterized membrane protein HdeD (DUF308 family)